MALRAASRREQRGAALIALAAILVLGVSWMTISALGNVSQRTAANREHNARVLVEAKAALAAWVAINAFDGTENNPGRLPCPQAWGDVGSANEGRAAPSCSVPAAGWLPWRTLGLRQPRDASGNQIWYVISPGWHLPNTGATLTINSNTAGQLTLDGQAAVALLIAPGPPLAIAPNANQLAAGCTARNQSQAIALPGTAPNPLDFLDCQNGSTADNVFVVSVVDNATNWVFNDQVLAVTAADVLPGLEAAISKRIERDIAPVLKGIYASSTWGLNISSTNQVFPFAAPFSNPTTSSYQGLGGQYVGLLPFNHQTVGCNPATDPRCATTLIAWSSGTPPTAYDAGGWGYIQWQPPCTWQSGGNIAECQGEYHENSASPSMPGMRIEMSVTLNNVAMGLRTLDITNKMTVEARNDSPDPWLPQAVTHTKTLNPNGSMTFTFGATLPNIDVMGWDNWARYRIRFDRSNLFGDHALLDPANATTGWFVRNEWYRLLYYVTAAGHTTAPLPAAPSCTTGTNCVSVANMTPAAAQRAILILAGRSINGSTRPSTALSDYLEQGNATGAFVLQPVSRATPFNDRVVVVDANP